MLKEPRPHRLNPFFGTLALVFVLLDPSHSGIVLGGAVGGTHDSDAHEFAWSAFLYHKFDQQVLIGLKSGRQSGGIPLLGALYVRLPLGRVLMPVAVGDLGYFYHARSAGFMWKTGGGIDWKNGERSSILLLGGVERADGATNLYSRVGLLLEF